MKKIFFLIILVLYGLKLENSFCAQANEPASNIPIFGDGSLDEKLAKFQELYAKINAGQRVSEYKKKVIKQIFNFLQSNEVKRLIAKIAHIRKLFSVHKLYPEADAKIALSEQSALKEYQNILDQINNTLEKRIKLSKIQAIEEPNYFIIRIENRNQLEDRVISFITFLNDKNIPYSFAGIANKNDDLKKYLRGGGQPVLKDIDIKIPYPLKYSVGSISKPQQLILTDFFVELDWGRGGITRWYSPLIKIERGKIYIIRTPENFLDRDINQQKLKPCQFNYNAPIDRINRVKEIVKTIRYTPENERDFNSICVEERLGKELLEKETDERLDKIIEATNLPHDLANIISEYAVEK